MSLSGDSIYVLTYCLFLTGAAWSGGSVDKVDVWGRRKLAYIIEKQREGQYVLLNLTMNPAATADLERNLRYQEPIIRHMLSVAA